MNSVYRISFTVFFFVAFSLLVNSVDADLVTIDFDNFAPTTSFAGGVEEDFEIDNLSGPVAVSSQYLGAFSGANSIHHQSPGLAIFEISHTSGQLFQLQSFQAGSEFGSLVQFTVSGFLDGIRVGSETYTPTDGSYVLLTAPSLSGVDVYQIVFNLGNAQIGPTHIDDIVIETVSIPEPSFAMLGFAFFAGVGLLGRPTRRNLG